MNNEFGAFASHLSSVACEVKRPDTNSAFGWSFLREDGKWRREKRRENAISSCLVRRENRVNGKWGWGSFLSWPTNVLSKMERKLEEGKMSRLPALFKNNMGIIVINSPCFHFFILSTKHTW